jgi:hypothetical protein
VPDAPASSFDGVASYSPTGEEGGNAALFTGTVVQTLPCIATEDSEGVTYIPVFPVDQLELKDGHLVFGGTDLVLGAEVTLPGGVVETAPEGSTVPDGCEGTLWLVNA